MNTCFYSDVLWLHLGYRISTLNNWNFSCAISDGYFTQNALLKNKRKTQQYVLRAWVFLDHQLQYNISYLTLAKGLYYRLIWQLLQSFQLVGKISLSDDNTNPESTNPKVIEIRYKLPFIFRKFDKHGKYGSTWLLFPSMAWYIAFCLFFKRF